jgi:hypothetical protein
LLYGLFLRGLYVWLSARLGSPTRYWLRAAPVVAALFDVVENLLQIHLVGQVLGGRAGEPSFMVEVPLMSTCAAVKAFLLVCSVLGTVAVVLRSEAAFAVWTCRFAIVSVLLGSFPLSSTSQGLDLLRVVADDALSKVQTGVTYLALVLWAASVWYWSRVLLQIRWTAREAVVGRGEEAGRRIDTWLPRVLGTATLLLAAIAFWTAARGMPEPLHGRLLWHGGYCLVLAAAFYYFVKVRRAKLKLPGPVQVGSWRDLPLATRIVAAGALALSTLVLCLFVSAAVPVGQRLGAPAILFLAAANAVFFGSATVLVSRHLRIPFVVFALIAAAVFSRWNDNHALRLLGSTPQPRPPLREAFEAWVGPRLQDWRNAGKPGKLPVVLVAAEGGGVRAAYWTATALGRLQDRHPAFARHVFAISGVSGGSLGAAVFVALVHDDVPGPACRKYALERRHSVEGIGSAEACAQEVLRQDLLAPALGKLLAPDFLQWFLPVPVPAFDRALAIEDSWSAAYAQVTEKDTLNGGFLEASRCTKPECADEGTIAHPALLLNGTHVHTGQRLLRAPFSWPIAFADDPTQEQMPQVTDLTELLQSDVRLATAAHDSARFAYVSPAGRLLSAAGRDFGHVVDGGYFENSGAATLKDVALVLQDSAVKDDVELLLLYLCNNPGRCFGATEGADPAQGQPKAPGLGEAFAPVRALLGARDARGALAIAHMRQALGRRFLEIGVCPVADEPPVPLGWQLSESMRLRLSAQVAGIGAPGNLETESCLREALGASPSTCRPPFTPAQGCPSGAPRTVPELQAESVSRR